MPVIVQKSGIKAVVIERDGVVSTVAPTPRTVVVERLKPTKKVEKTVEKVEIPQNEIVESVSKDTKVIEVASTGMRGPKGFDGVSGSAEITTSRENGSPYPLYKGQVVASDGGKWYPASSAPGPWSEAVGFVVEDVIVAGGTGRAQVSGVFSMLTAQWDVVQTYTGGLVPETPYYLSESGLISPVPPLSDSGQMYACVGYALNSTDLVIEIDPTIQL